MQKTLLIIAADIDIDYPNSIEKRCLFANYISSTPAETQGLFSISQLENYTLKVYQPRGYSLANATYTQGVDAVLITYQADTENTSKTIESIIVWLNDLLERDRQLTVIIVGYHTHITVNPELNSELSSLCHEWGVPYYGVVKLDMVSQSCPDSADLLTYIEKTLGN